KQGSAGFTGITGIPVQDASMTWSMGPIFDRRSEHLGTSDAMIIRTRRRLIAAAKALAEQGITPPGVDTPQAYRVRSGWIHLPEGADWLDETRDLRQAFVDHPELAGAVQSP
ncbi:MAG: hypothetical protein KGJ86_17010, partial [Chloroflexota bacterium]|nr:hypothetical protein [Chloroflexota bacterium]